MIEQKAIVTSPMEGIVCLVDIKSIDTAKLVIARGFL